MAGLYQHTQRASTSVRAWRMVAPVLFGAVAIGRGLTLIHLSAAAIFFGLGGLEWRINQSLTLEVSGTEIRWYFGPGLWDYRVALSDIEGVRIVRESWLTRIDSSSYQGRGGGLSCVGFWRIRGWRLYNLTGRDAVELRLKTGDIRRIGTDDPQGLAAALKCSGPA